MPQTTVNGVQIYYEQQGQGPPLVLVQGLGYSSQFWFKQTPVLGDHFQLLTFDNRDVGRSEIVDEEYEITDMAQDTRELLDTLDLTNVHLLGLSMGGYIAQQLAVDSPELVDKLILISTQNGDPRYMQATQDLWEEILDVEGLSLDEVYRKGFRYSVSQDFFENRRDFIEELIEMRMDNPQPPAAFQRQFQAASRFSLQDRIKEIQAPTLIVAGENDRIVPNRFARQLHDLIPDSQLEIVGDAAHLVHLEQPERLNSLTLDFLGDHNA